MVVCRCMFLSQPPASTQAPLSQDMNPDVGLFETLHKSWRPTVQPKFNAPELASYSLAVLRLSCPRCAHQSSPAECTCPSILLRSTLKRP